MNVIKTLLAALVISIFGFGCGADAALDCANICDEYSDCLSDQGQNIDVTECADRCEDQSDDNQAFQDAADTCDDCLSENEDMCSNCSQQCNVFLSIVAQSTE